MCSAPVINLPNLESAVGATFQTFDGVYLHASVVARSAKLLEGLAVAHGFRDGNKRIAWLACVIFLNLNNLDVCGVTEEEAADFVLGILAHEYAFPDIVEFLNGHVELLAG